MKNMFTPHGFTYEIARCRVNFDGQKSGKVAKLINPAITDTETKILIYRGKLALVSWLSETESKFICESQKIPYVPILSDLILRIKPGWIKKC